jgi:hypothetical protein
MESVNVLFDGDSVKDFRDRKLGRERQLDEDSVARPVSVQFGNTVNDNARVRLAGWPGWRSAR